MTASLSWVHFGDLHVDEADAMDGLTQFRRLAEQIATHAHGLDFAFLPGDNANHGTPDQYRGIAEVMATIDLPWHVIAGITITSPAIWRRCARSRRAWRPMR